ncbi:MAG: hypothetical protein RLZZ561_1938 [Pseudomonadota bacterium]
MVDPIFSNKRRRLNRARAMRAPADSRWLLDRMAEDLADRLSFMTLNVTNALLIGHGARELAGTLGAEAALLQCDLAPAPKVHLVADEDRLPIADASMDLVVACGMLDSIDDLPGALILMRRALRPGGLFLGAMLGAGTLSGLKGIIQTLEASSTLPSAVRFHPQIDVRSAGDLLFRAGFSTPVADQDVISVNYGSFRALRTDIIGAGTGNALNSRQPMSRELYSRARAEIDAGHTEIFAPIFLTGWAPDIGETKPAGPVKGLGGAL